MEVLGHDDHTIIVKTNKTSVLHEQLKLMKDTQIIFSFAALQSGTRIEDVIPHAWAIVPFKADQLSHFEETWSSNYCFAVASTTDGPFITPLTYIPIKMGESTTLSGDSHKGFAWLDPVPQPDEPGKETIRADNATGMPQTLVFGTLSPNGLVRTMSRYGTIEAASSVIAKPPWVLRAYYTENLLYSSNIAGELLGENGVDISTLKRTTAYDLYSDPVDGKPRFELLPSDASG